MPSPGRLGSLPALMLACALSGCRSLAALSCTGSDPHAGSTVKRGGGGQPRGEIVTSAQTCDTASAPGPEWPARRGSPPTRPCPTLQAGRAARASQLLPACTPRCNMSRRTRRTSEGTSLAPGRPPLLSMRRGRTPRREGLH
eukprot:370970-Rhodomonas_salina.5